MKSKIIASTLAVTMALGGAVSVIPEGVIPSSTFSMSANAQSISELKKLLNEAIAERSAIVKSYSSLSSALKKANVETEKAYVAMIVSKTNYDKASKTYNNLVSNKEDLIKAISTDKTNISNLEKSNANLTTTNSSLDTQLSSYNSSLLANKNKLVEVNYQINGNTSRMEVLHKENQSLHEENVKLKAEYDKLAESNDALKEKNTALRKKLENTTDASEKEKIQAQITANGEKYEANSARAAEIKKTMGANGEQYEKNGKKYTELQKANVSLNSTKSTLNSTISNLNSKITSTKKSISDNNAKINSNTASITKLKSQLNDNNTKLTAIIPKVDEAKKEVDTTSSTYSKDHTNYLAKKSVSNDYTDKVNSAQDKYDYLTKRINALKLKVNAADVTIVPSSTKSTTTVSNGKNVTTQGGLYCSLNRVYGYTGKKINAKPTVKYNKKTLVKDKDYTVTYKNNVNVGYSKVIIKGKGKYKFTLNSGFYIKPARTAILKFNRSKSKATVTFKKVKGIDGYDIKLSTSPSFSNNTQIIVRNSKKTKVTFTSLKPNTKYYVKIRTFKKVSPKVDSSSYVTKNGVKVSKSSNVPKKTYVSYYCKVKAFRTTKK